MREGMSMILSWKTRQLSCCHSWTKSMSTLRLLWVVLNMAFVWGIENMDDIMLKLVDHHL